MADAAVCTIDVIGPFLPMLIGKTTLACADEPALEMNDNKVLQEMTHAATVHGLSHIGNGPALDVTTFVQNVQELLAILEQNDATYKALSSVLGQVVGYDSSAQRLHKNKLFQKYSDGTALLEDVRGSIESDAGLLPWVFKKASDPNDEHLRRQGVWNYVVAAVDEGGARQDRIVRDVGFWATILMLGFVTKVADQVEMASRACRCKFVAVTDASQPRKHSFIMCAILALGSAYYNARYYSILMVGGTCLLTSQVVGLGITGTILEDDQGELTEPARNFILKLNTLNSRIVFFTFGQDW